MGSEGKPQTLWCYYAAQLWQNHNDVSNELKGKKSSKPWIIAAEEKHLQSFFNFFLDKYL